MKLKFDMSMCIVAAAGYMAFSMLSIADGAAYKGWRENDRKK